MFTAFLLSAISDHTVAQNTAPIALTAKAKQRLQASSREAEAALIKQALAGDQSAYAALVRRYNRMVFGLVLQMLGNREDALEVTQDAFLKAFRFLGSYRGESRFSTWLYHIARTSAINRLRRVRRDIVALDAPEAAVRQMTASMADGYDVLVSSEQTDILLRAFQLLRPDDGTVLRLFYMQEQSLEEICKIMDWTMSNAKSRLCRARQRLRQVLEAHFAEELSEWV